MSEGIKLSEVCNIKGGSGFPEKYQGKKAGNYPFIKVSDMNLPENRQTITKANNYVDDNLVKSLGLTVFPKNTIVFAKVGAAVYLNKRRILSEDTIIDNNMMGVVPHHIDSFFLYYLLLNVDLSIFIQPGALPSVNQNIVGNLLIPNYRLERQVHIRNILGSIDRAIAHTEALIEKYQQIKAGLMHDLFTRGIGADGKLRPTREEAPELYQESAIGWIPKDWNWEIVADLCSQVVDCPHSTPTYRDLGIPCIRTADMEVGELLLEQAYCVDEKDYKIRTQRLVPKEGDIIYSREGERLGIASPVGVEKVCLGQRVMLLRPDSNTDPSFLLWSMNHIDFYRRVVRGLGATTSPHVNVGDIKAIPISVPTYSEQVLIGEKINAVQGVLNREKSFRSKLQQKKNGLMHDLLTGKVA